MKPAPFAFERVDRAREAIERLSEYGDDAKLIAGGQSLVPLLAFRLVRPTALVDISRVEELRYVRLDGDVLRIGALTRHRALETLPAELRAAGFGLVADAARLVGHLPIRTRGTIGGSLAHADPAAEWCLLAVLLDGELVVRGPQGERTLAAADFFEGYLTTAIEPGEMLVEVKLRRPGHAAAIEQQAARHGDFAIASAAVTLDLDTDGTCLQARVALGAVDDRAVRAADAEAVLVGVRPTPAKRRRAAAAAAAAVSPPADSRGDTAYRQQLTRVLVERALARAAADHDRTRTR